MSGIIRWLSATAFMLFPCLASAYIGPGAGLSAIGTVLALIGAVLLLVVGFVWYPVKRFLKRRNTSPSGAETGIDGSTDSDSE